MSPTGETSLGTARIARLVGALWCCREGRKLLEEAREAGIDLGHPRPGASSLQLSSTAVFMSQDVFALCRQVNPFMTEADAFNRTTAISKQLIETANRQIWAEPVVRNKVALNNAPKAAPADVKSPTLTLSPKPEFVR